MDKEILTTLTQIKWMLGVICFYIIWRDIFKGCGGDSGNKS
jgi:hypothetical protein